MILNISKTERDTGLLNRMLCIWEGAVRDTHTFLNENDIQTLKPQVLQALTEIPLLNCYVDESSIEGFIGIESKKIEMLFVDAAIRGKGIGKQLVRHAVDCLGVLYVDVNEQNIQGLGFYEHMGFRVIGRSTVDEQGRPFPILHMQIQSFVE